MLRICIVFIFSNPISQFNSKNTFPCVDLPGWLIPFTMRALFLKFFKKIFFKSFFLTFALFSTVRISLKTDLGKIESRSLISKCQTFSEPQTRSFGVASRGSAFDAIIFIICMPPVRHCAGEKMVLYFISMAANLELC